MYEKIIKPIFDFLLALLILVLSSPFLLLGMLYIKWDSKGPVLFKQERIGKDNQIIIIYKLRTMILDQYDQEGRKLRDKERVTKAGKLIRKLSLDEIPQLINILKGEMSFIGPRPLLVRYYPYYTDEELRRHDVKPGLTGLAQINGRSNIGWEERFKYDVEYVDNLSFALDVHIFFETLMKVIKGSDTSVSNRPKNLVSFDQHRRFKKLR